MGTVTKALSLLTLFSHARPEIGLSDMTRLSGMNKATVYRMLCELQAQGFVEQVGSDRAYRLGPEILRLAALREAAVPVLSVSRPLVERLCAATGETVHLSLVQGHRLHTLIHCYSPRHATRVMMDNAETLSFHATSSGLAILGFSTPEFVEKALSEPLERFTDRTETDPQRLRATLERVRRTGIAEAVGIFEADVHSHAAPVFGADQRPIGAVAVATPVTRMTDSLKAQIGAELKICARDLTQRIGGFIPPEYPMEAAA